jgi:hypothetical protein
VELARARAYRGLHEHRGVTALGQLDAQRIHVARQQVVTLERTAQAPGLHAHDGIDDGVEVRLAAEHFDGDRGLLEVGAAAGQHFLDHVAQEFARARRAVEVRAVQHAIEMGTH